LIQRSNRSLRVAGYGFDPDAGHESHGVVDQMAVRKDHRKSLAGAKRGDALQIILIQVKSTPVDYSHKLSWEFARNKFEAESFAYTGEDLNAIRASPWRGFENRSKQPKIAEVQASDKNEAFRVLPSRPSAHFHKFT
jgi:hypothetical protein